MRFQPERRWNTANTDEKKEGDVEKGGGRGEKRAFPLLNGESLQAGRARNDEVLEWER